MSIDPRVAQIGINLSPEGRISDVLISENYVDISGHDIMFGEWHHDWMNGDPFNTPGAVYGLLLRDGFASDEVHLSCLEQFAKIDGASFAAEALAGMLKWVTR